jgi:hypothetical protein
VILAFLGLQMLVMRACVENEVMSAHLLGYRGPGSDPEFII